MTLQQVHHPNGTPATCAYCGSEPATMFEWDDSRRRRYALGERCRSIKPEPPPKSRSAVRRCRRPWCRIVFIDPHSDDKRCFAHRSEP